MSDRSSFKTLDMIRSSVATVLAAMLLFGVLFSSTFIAEEFHHDCVGDECPICQTIAQCEAFLNRIATGTALFVVSVMAVVAVISGALLYVSPAASGTLVSCKVRLNN